MPSAMKNGPKNDIIRTIIKDITWEIFLQSSKPVSLKIVRFQLFSVQLIGRTPGIHWCHFHIDTMKYKQIQILYNLTGRGPRAGQAAKAQVGYLIF